VSFHLSIMFSHESTENLLDNLESELTEMVELERPGPKPLAKVSPVPGKKRTPPPVPARRNVQASISDHPVAATRRVSSLDKKEKNDENEIIQLQSLTSDHDSMTSESQRGTSKQNTVIVLNEKNARVATENANETFFVIKHGKWASEQEEENHQPKDAGDEIRIERDEEEQVMAASEGQKTQSTQKSKKKKKVLRKKHESQSSSTTSASHTLADTSSTESSTLEESPLPVKKKVKKGGRSRRKEKKEEQLSASSCTESGKNDMTSNDKAIGECAGVENGFWG
jgi:hypothetical protein